MKKQSCLLAFFCVLLLAFSSCRRSQSPMSPYYAALDSVIAASDGEVKAQEARIARLEKAFAKATDARRRLALAENLFDAYSSFVNDSAVAWARRGMALAGSLGLKRDAELMTLGLIEQYTKSGYFSEAYRYFSQLDSQRLERSLLPRYYDVGSSLYGNMGYSTYDPAMQQSYWQTSSALRDELYAIVSPGSELEVKSRVQQYNNMGLTSKAEAWGRRWERLVRPGTHAYAIMAYHRSETCRIRGSQLAQMQWLARSAVADIGNAIMDQASLWMLAALIYKGGDLDRAYRYMAFSWRQVSRFSTHKRAWDITPILTVINQNYQLRSRQSTRRLTLLVILTAALLVVSAAMLVYVQRKRRQLAHARARLAEGNRRLSRMVAKLNDVNNELNESNRVKDKYIGQFFSMCSHYIDKLDAFRGKVRRRLKAGQTQELYDLTDPDAMLREEHQALLRSFDDVFLSLFPSFADDFNALLRPECRMQPQGNERLNTTMRIFALIRLGITESSRIAEILGYAPNSIYNYRTRAKNMAACPREEFEEKVGTIHNS